MQPSECGEYLRLKFRSYTNAVVTTGEHLPHFTLFNCGDMYSRRRSAPVVYGVANEILKNLAQTCLADSHRRQRLVRDDRLPDSLIRPRKFFGRNNDLSAGIYGL